MPILDFTTYRRLRAVLDARIPERLAALEARLGLESPRPLAGLNASRTADAERLRAAIAVLLTEHHDAAPLAAKRVLRVLEERGYAPLPSLRTVYRALEALGAGSVT